MLNMNPYILGATSAPFLPGAYGTCIAWLLSDTGVTKDGGNLVSSWADQSGTGNDFIQANGLLQPLWVDAQVNGYPSIRHDGIDNYLACAGITISDPTDMYIVMNTITWVGGTRIAGGQAWEKNILYVSASPTICLFSVTALVPTTNDLPVATWGLLQARFNDANSQLRVNGGTASTANPGSFDTTGGYAIGAELTPAEYSNVEFAEIIIYSDALSDANRGFVESYIRAKYLLW